MTKIMLYNKVKVYELIINDLSIQFEEEFSQRCQWSNPRIKSIEIPDGETGCKNVNHREKCIIYRHARTLIRHRTLCNVSALCIPSLSNCIVHFISMAIEEIFFANGHDTQWNDWTIHRGSWMENGQSDNDCQTMKTIPFNWKTWFTIVKLVIRRIINEMN